MYIKQLEIDNFKSFANKSEIPLLKGFTTVSGPNGSGKSNIIDSVYVQKIYPILYQHIQKEMRLLLK